MIASLRGTVLVSEHAALVIDIGGVGMRVEVTPECAARAPEHAQVFLHTQLIVREDALTLFGFESKLECDVFTLLLGVSGVGPRSALAILAEMSPSSIAAAVHADDEAPFKKVSGVGPKTAKLISVSLAGKLDHVSTQGDSSHADSPKTQSALTDVVQALIGLGWGEAAASEAVQSARHAGASEDEQELLRSALLLLQNSPGRR